MDASHTWSHLKPQQVGRYAEQLVAMRLVMLGMQVFRSEIDDRGIDIVLRKDPTKSGGLASYWDIQVKSLRIGPGRSCYAFMKKRMFELRRSLLLSLVLFQEGREPDVYLIPSERWKIQNPMFVDRNYGGEGQKSEPEYGISVSIARLANLEPYRLDHQVRLLYA